MPCLPIDHIFVPIFCKKGTHDWHMGRKFSLTSSQAHGSVIAAFPLFKDKPEWIKVVSFLYGEENWREALNIPRAPGHASASSSDDDATSVGSNSPPTRSIQEYLGSFVPAEGNDFQRFAMIFLKKYVFSEGVLAADDSDSSSDSDSDDDAPSLQTTQDLDAEGAVVASETEAKKIVAGMRSQARREALKILALQVEHEPFRSKPSAKDLTLWLQKTNSTRDYLFYKNAGLKALVKARSLTLATGSRTMAGMIRALAGSSDAAGTSENAPASSGNDEEGGENSARIAAITAILKKSFLPFRKGAARDTCNLGHRLEKPILKSWVEIVRGHEQFYAPPARLCWR